MSRRDVSGARELPKVEEGTVEHQRALSEKSAASANALRVKRRDDKIIECNSAADYRIRRSGSGCYILRTSARCRCPYVTPLQGVSPDVQFDKSCRAVIK